jgi:hypothetical protein
MTLTVAAPARAPIIGLRYGLPWTKLALVSGRGAAEGRADHREGQINRLKTLKRAMFGRANNGAAQGQIVADWLNRRSPSLRMTPLLFF